MIKVVAVLLGVAVIGGALYWVLSPFLLPMIGSATLPSLFVTAQEKIQPIITYVQENAVQVGSMVTAGGAAVAVLSSKIHTATMQKKEIETTIKQNDLQSSLFQAQGEVLGLKNQLTDAKSTITTLKDNASNMAEITEQLSAKTKEVEKLQAQIQGLERVLPSVEKAEQMIKDKMKVG